MRPVAILFLPLILLFTKTAIGQQEGFFEAYYYAGKGISTLNPMFHVETEKGWYAEARYNYEDVKTFSLFGGKSFKGGENLTYTLTPLVGYSGGQFNGPTLGLNGEFEWKKFFAASQSQYSYSVSDRTENFFFTWSEAGYNISDHLYAGLAVQYTHLSEGRSFEPGFLAGFSINDNISFPIYAFSPFDRERYFVIGFNYSFRLNNYQGRKN